MRLRKPPIDISESRIPLSVRSDCLLQVFQAPIFWVKDHFCYLCGAPRMKQIQLQAQDHVNMNGVGALQCAFRTVTSCALPLKHHFPHLHLFLLPSHCLVHSVGSAGIHHSFRGRTLKHPPPAQILQTSHPVIRSKKRRGFSTCCFLYTDYLLLSHSSFYPGPCLTHVFYWYHMDIKSPARFWMQLPPRLLFLCVCLEYKTRQKYSFNK